MHKLFVALIFGLLTACTSGDFSKASFVGGLDENGDAIPIATYVVEGDDIQGNITNEQLAVWQRFTEVIPAELRPEIVSFQPIDSEATDGIDGTVFPMNDTGAEWAVMLDTSGAVEADELDRTMVHEYAHLLSLRNSQIDRSYTSGACGGVVMSDGCLNADSYLGTFTVEYWNGVAEPEGTAAERFEANPTDYVTEYAATSSTEDFAESMAEYVVAPEKWQDSTVASQKVQWMDELSDIVDIAETIRLNF